MKKVEEQHQKGGGRGEKDGSTLLQRRGNKRQAETTHRKTKEHTEYDNGFHFLNGNIHGYI